MKKLSLVTTLCAGILAAGALQAKTYTCNVTPDSSRDWISKTLVFNIDDNSGAIRVFDGIVEKYSGKPVAGKLSIETAKRVTITWTTRQVRDGYGHSSARFMFRASYYKDSGKMIISSMPGGWDNRFGGSGRCTISSDAGWDAALRTAKSSPFSTRGRTPFFAAGEWIILPP